MFEKVPKWVIITDIILILCSGAAFLLLLFDIITRKLGSEFLVMLLITLFLCCTGIYDLYLNAKRGSGLFSNSKGKGKNAKKTKGTAHASQPNRPNRLSKPKKQKAAKKHKK